MYLSTRSSDQFIAAVGDALAAGVARAAALAAVGDALAAVGDACAAAAGDALAAGDLPGNSCETSNSLNGLFDWLFDTVPLEEPSTADRCSNRQSFASNS